MRTHDVGIPTPLSAAIPVGTGISAFRTASELASTFEFEDDPGHRWFRSLLARAAVAAQIDNANDALSGQHQ